MGSTLVLSGKPVYDGTHSMRALAANVIANALAELQKGEMRCPFCGAPREHLFPYEDGPRLELHEGPVDAVADAEFMRHRVYCGKEDRNFAVMYRVTAGLPACSDCKTELDVVADPPARHFNLTPSFVAAARCEGCGEDLGEVIYEAFDVRDEGLLGN